LFRTADDIPTVLPMHMEGSPPSAADEGAPPISVDPDRQHIYQETQKLWESLLHHVREEALRPQGKHRLEVSIFCETLLRLYAQSLAPAGVWPSCQAILDFMNVHKLTLQEAHCQAALTVSVREGHYAQAASLFRQRLEPDQAPYRSLSVAEPLGLLALARDAQARDGPVVEHVLEAVHRLCMLSSSDQGHYVLAAGTALGYSGHGLDLVAYLRTSPEASRLGPTLVAAAMQACILSGDASVAWSLWEEKSAVGLADEWQWSGGQEALPPICTDLALRAAPAGDHVDSETVLALYRSLVDSGRTVSMEALVGLVRVLEREGQWETAANFFLSLLPRAAEKPFVVYGDALEVPDVEQAAAASEDLIHELTLVVVPVMRACQAAHEYATALVCFSLLQAFIDASTNVNTKHNAWLSQLQSTVVRSSNGEDLLVAILASLCGLDMADSACELHDLCTQDMSDWSDALELRTFAEHLPSTTPLQSHVMLTKLGQDCQRFALVRGHLSKLSTKDALLVSSALATTMDSFTTWGHPSAALFLCRWILGNDSREVTRLHAAEGIFESASPLPLTDSLASALMQAYFSRGDSEMALRIFDSTTKKDITGDWSQSTNVATRILFSAGAGVVDDAMHIFSENSRRTTNPDIYVTAATGLAAQGRWNEISEVYRLALTSRALSEELSLLAMQGIEESRMPEKSRLLRNIAAEAASLTGMAPLAWIERQYHRLKGVIPFPSLRKLLWWDDATTAHLDELELVLGQWQARKTQIRPTLAPQAASVRIILEAAKSLHDDFIPAGKTQIPHVPSSRSAWKTLVDEIVQDLDLSVWKDADAETLVYDIILAYRNLGGDDDCLSFTFSCLEREMTVSPAALREALEAAVSINDSRSTLALRLLVQNGPD
jgi:hypothetical protein